MGFGCCAWLSSLLRYATDLSLFVDLLPLPDHGHLPGGRVIARKHRTVARLNPPLPAASVQGRGQAGHRHDRVRGGDHPFCTPAHAGSGAQGGREPGKRRWAGIRSSRRAHRGQPPVPPAQHGDQG